MGSQNLVNNLFIIEHFVRQQQTPDFERRNNFSLFTYIFISFIHLCISDFCMFYSYICIFAVYLNIFVHYNDVKSRLLYNNWM